MASNFHRVDLKCTLLTLVILTVALFRPIAHSADQPIIVAASSLQFALQKINKQFRKDTGRNVLLSFGSSGNFTRQIRQGAPYELFLSANEQFVFDLADEELTVDNGSVYAIGQLAIALPLNTTLTNIDSFEQVLKQIAAKENAKFALANPLHAPYGQRSKQLLEHIGLWPQFKDKLILGENVAQTAQFALSSNTEGGIIALALAKSAKLSSRGHFLVIPSKLHDKLNHRMVLLRGAGDTARQFYNYVLDDKAKSILQEHGFSLPKDAFK